MRARVVALPRPALLSGPVALAVALGVTPTVAALVVAWLCSYVAAHEPRVLVVDLEARAVELRCRRAVLAELRRAGDRLSLAALEAVPPSRVATLVRGEVQR